MQRVYGAEGDNAWCRGCMVQGVHVQRVHGTHTERTQCRGYTVERVLSSEGAWCMMWWCTVERVHNVHGAEGCIDTGCMNFGSFSVSFFLTSLNCSIVLHTVW